MRSQVPHRTDASTEMGLIVFALIALAVSGCKRAPRTEGVDAAPVSPVATASVASPTTSTTLDASPPERCTKAALQHERCFPHAGPLTDGSIADWFARHALGNPQLLERDPVAACREAVFNERPALVCELQEGIEVSKTLGPDGPHAIWISLLVVTSDGARAKKALTVPTGVYSSVDLLFHSDVAIDGSEIDVRAPDCEAAVKDLDAYWRPKIAEAKKGPEPKVPIALAEERAAEAKQLSVVCRSARRYTVPR